ncbi:PREDICTED: rho guanine nucleotide exchange factor 18 [Papilio polytes]|uniref:rho guanine nucleotide exchange factor 18 n=1 Tax=Papilio polytes TaxID=76194 RepID=UPI0006762F76|nr:PREDICTED: rho guanine nucleotide exchange factor 18 [Papilio polytes]
MNVPPQVNEGDVLSSDEGGGSSESRSDSSEDEVTEHAPRATPTDNMAAARAQVPTISVTPHSPGVLDDSLQQLRRLNAAVQRMRAAPLPLLATGNSRLSTSCPSLCKDGVVEPECSSPTHLDFYPQSRKGSGDARQWGGWGGWGWDRRDEGRRSSWAALEPGAKPPDARRQRSNLNGHSASLSSMESESEVPRPVRHSTHSLNDNDLARTSWQFLKTNSVKHSVFISKRIKATLACMERKALYLSLGGSLSTGGASETESDEDLSVQTEGNNQLPGRRNNTHQEHLGLDRLTFLEQAAFDHHAEKRRKRGSLFFRKKKDKSRKAAHVWQAAGSGGHCDWCARAVADKPALYCDNCTMTVHQNVCKDYIVECNKPKSSKTSVGKSLSTSSGKSSKRSSVSGQSQNANSTSIYADDKDGSDHKHDQSEFCSRHREAVEVFKECCTREPRLARFIRKCQQNPLLRKKGVPECVLFVAQRLTKYPLLLEPLLKTAGDDVVEKELLQKALCGVKEILVDVDNQVAAKEREDRKLEMYHRIDAKSFAHYRGRKFKKSDILHGNRSLKFEGVATLMQGRSKMQTLLVIVLTDVLFFLHDNNNKYTFFTPENKKRNRNYIIFLKQAQVILVQRQAAVQSCPEEVEESEAGALASSAEERQRQLEARHENIRLITEALRLKDREHAVLLEEKMALHMKMVGHTGSSTLDVPHTGITSVFPGGLVFPDYVRLSAPSPDTHALWQEVCKVVKDALEASSGTWTGGIALGRSTSSAGERHSSAYQSPALPRRADTFAGFDAAKHRVEIHDNMNPGVAVRLSTDTAMEGGAPGEQEEAGGEEPRLLDQLGGDAALKLQHAIYTLTCIVWQQLTTIHSLEAQVCAWRCSGGVSLRTHDAQLEELRHAQARLTAERAAWEAQRAADNASLADERRQLAVARQELEEQQKDVEQQRERLYRRLERLQQHGGSQEEIASVGTLSPDSSVSDTTRRKEPKWRNNRGSTGSESSACVPPPQLLSAHNESRATVRAPAISQMVKQQLPLKLASGKNQQPPAGFHTSQR